MKTIIIACGSGVATSTIISTKVKELLEKNHIQCNIIQTSIHTLDTYLNQADLVVSSIQICRELPIPKVNGMPYLTSIGEAQVSQKILEILNL